MTIFGSDHQPQTETRNERVLAVGAQWGLPVRELAVGLAVGAYSVPRVRLTLAAGSGGGWAVRTGVVGAHAARPGVLEQLEERVGEQHHVLVRAHGLQCEQPRGPGFHNKAEKRSGQKRDHAGASTQVLAPPPPTAN